MANLPSPGASALTIDTVSIRQIDGLYSLNDLHKASGGELKNRPVEFMRLEQTKALIAEIEKVGIPTFKIQRGKNGGTYACRELVIAYAAWISAAFHLKVIRVFLSQATPGRLNTPTETGEQIIMKLHSVQAGAMPDEMKRKIIKLVKTRWPSLYENALSLDAPPLEYPEPVKGRKYDRRNPYPRDGETIEIAQDIAIAIRNWAWHQPPTPASRSLEKAAQTLHDLLVSGWTEVDEALGSISRGVHYLHRWQGRGGRMGNAGP
jgi:hypothetical protein